jgi:flagellar hook-associated protein 1
MSLGLTLSNALSGLHVSQRALSVTSHNVANVNTEGYARKVAHQEARTHAGQLQGALSKDLTRTIDAFLATELREQTTALGRSAAVQRFHARILDMLGRPGDGAGLDAAVSRLGAALESFATTPETPALAYEVVAAAEGLAEQLARIADQAQDIRRAADREIAYTVEQINDELQAAHKLNLEIGRLTALGQSTVDLEDKRDALVQRLGETLDIHTYHMDTGRIAITTKHGTTLLDGEPRTLVYEAAGHVAAGTTFGALTVYPPQAFDADTGELKPDARGAELISSGVRAAPTLEMLAGGADPDELRVTTTLRSGALVGLLEMRDRVLPELDDQLQEVATVLRHALNAAHNDAVPQPPPSALAGTRTDLDDFDALERSGTGYLAVVDADGTTLATVAVDVTLADADAVAASIDGQLAGLGTAVIDGDGRLALQLADPAHGLALARGDSRVVVEDDAGRRQEYGFAHYFGLNDLLVQQGGRASDLALTPQIRDDPSRIGTARLDVDPGPPPAAALGGAGDNRGAQGLAGALTQGQDFIARGGLPSARASITEYVGDLVGNAASKAARANAEHERDGAMVAELAARVGEVSGVSMDEELARLIVYQRAYLASARIVSVTDQLFEAMIAMKR